MNAIKFMRALATAIIAIAIVLVLAESVDAANRSPEGAVKMPANKTLKLAFGKRVKINFGNDYDYTSNYYFKIKATKTGYITFWNDYTHGSSVALLNAKKKIVSRDGKYDCFLSAGSQYIYQRTVAFGVKKGRTYYIRVKGASGEREAYDQPYVGTVKCTLTKVCGLKYGKSRKKAVKIKRNKTKNGVIMAGVSGAQWYKIKSVKKNTNITFKAKNNSGTLYAKVFYKSYGKWYNSRMFAMRSSNSYTYKGKVKSNRKGNTYYIKVYRDGKSTGKYTLRWK